MPPTAPSCGAIDGNSALPSAHQSRTLVLAKPEGQLGNRLFLGATLLAHAAENHLRLLNPSLGEYADLFRGTCAGWFHKFPQKETGSGLSKIPGLPMIRKILAVSCNRLAQGLSSLGASSSRVRILDICHTHDVIDQDYDLSSQEFSNLCRGSGLLVLRGWKFRAHEALQRRHALIREVFRPVPSIEKVIEDAVAVGRSRVDRLIGVHVRQGDYRHWLGGKYFFENSRYIEWMRQAAALWPEEKVGFLLCTNGEWQEERMDDCPIFRGPGSPVGDLYALAACDAIMGPPSSFSMWASYYGQVPLHMLESAEQRMHPVTFTMHRRI